jgi:exodeoxyribonuclease V alpha subunit
MDRLRGVIERVTFHSQETGYTVAKLAPEHNPTGFFGARGEVTIVGNMVDINVGEYVELTGNWTVHSEYGKQFVVEQMRSVLPATIAGIEKYLGSGLIKGVGPVTAKRIVRRFALETLDIIERDPARLIEVPGVGAKRVTMITQAWAEQRAIKEVMLFLQSHGVSTSLATKIFKTYGDQAITVVQENPYRLAEDIYGIGFVTADTIAKALGMPPDSPQRVAAGIAFVLNQAAGEGHVYLPLAELIPQAIELLQVAPQQAALGLLYLWQRDHVKLSAQPGGAEMRLESLPVGANPPRLVADRGHLYAAATIEQADALLLQNPAVYLTGLFFSEVGAAGRLRRLLEEGRSRLEQFRRSGQEWDRLLATLEGENGIQLAPQQREAIRAALTHRLTILTGGPGTGKTTTVRTLLACCHAAGFQTLLAAPTGRAAKRLAETTGQEAKTLHRLLEFKPSEGMAFKRNEDLPLEGDLLIVDESSMLDLVLTHHMLKAVPPGMHLLLVGDIDQLPSVGAGNVLADLIRAVEEKQLPILGERAAVVRLQTIFRQAAESLIIANAHRINAGQPLEIANDRATDFFLFKTEEAERAAQLCVELVQSRIPRRFAIPSHDIQVLSPMHRGVAGVGTLNDALQAALNPHGPDKPQRLVGNRVYRTGDRVMQVRNNYDKDVYNGDMGVISHIDLEMQRLTVLLDGRAVPYDFTELDELVHAYAISVHKSQGSEFPAVVIPVLTSHYMMLQRNLLYTAVSRARRLVVLVGQPKAIHMALQNNRVTTRYTSLEERLVGNQLPVVR